jgi:hypothetical protein
MPKGGGAGGMPKSGGAGGFPKGGGAGGTPDLASIFGGMLLISN